MIGFETARAIALAYREVERAYGVAEVYRASPAAPQTFR